MNLNSREVYARFRDIVPTRKMAEMSKDEVKSSCMTAFDVIDYAPRNYEKSFERVWATDDSTMLFKFVWDVYMEDSHAGR
jgi:hypothetical protein